MNHRCPAAIPKGRWRELWTDSLAELGDATRADARLLERMVLNLIAANKALAAANKEPYVVGSKGQEVEHPGFKIAARCDGQALSIARQLRLTPLARSHATSSQTEDPFEALDQEDELAQARAKRAS